MRIHLLSDVHIEFGKFKHTPPECDVVVLAGDIGVGKQAFPWIERTFPHVPVIYVAGNHENYRRELRRHEIDMRKAAARFPNVHFLQNDSVIIDGVRFIGATMWTDMNLYGNPYLAILYADKNMSDYTYITRGRGRFKAEDSVAEHMISKQYLIDTLETPFDDKTVVVTHHAPTELSVNDQHKHDRLTPAYASRLENVMLAYDPVLWCHGHLHNKVDTMIGDTRVMCNPRGYVGHHLNPYFNPNLVVEI